MKDVVTIKKSKAMLAALRQDERTILPGLPGAWSLCDKKKPPQGHSHPAKGHGPPGMHHTMYLMDILWLLSDFASMER
jgi:hypothetical protein